jgi:hypothetical protein
LLEELKRVADVDQPHALRAAAVLAYAWGLIDHEDVAKVQTAIDSGAYSQAAERLVPPECRFGLWKSHDGWQAEIDEADSLEQWLSGDPIGYAVGCRSAAAALAAAALRARACRANMRLYGAV